MCSDFKRLGCFITLLIQYVQVFHSKTTPAIGLSEGSNELHTFPPAQINGHERAEEMGLWRRLPLDGSRALRRKTICVLADSQKRRGIF